MTNETFITRYINDTRKHVATCEAGSLTSIGSTLYSHGMLYRICIIDRGTKTITYFNKEDWSGTTTRHANLAARLLEENGFKLA